MMNIWKKQRHKHEAPRQPWDDDDAPTDQDKCPVCNGRGRVETVIQDDRVRDPAKLKTIMADCPYCGGTGRDAR